MDPRYFGSNLSDLGVDRARSVPDAALETAYYARYSPSTRLLPDLSGVAGIVLASLAIGIFAIWAV